MKPILKLVVAIILLLCLADMPYGYYQLVRIVAMIAFSILAYQYYRMEKAPLAITFGGLALLFQPFIKVALGRTIWNIVDVVVALFLIILLFKDREKN